MGDLLKKLKIPKDPESRWNLVLVLSLSVIVVTAICGFVAPAFTSHAQAVMSTQQAASRTRWSVVNKQLSTVESAIKERTLSQSADNVGGTILDAVSQYADKSQVELTGFKIGVSKSVSGMSIVPISIEFLGTFPNVIKMVKLIEARGSEFALGSLDLSSSNIGTDSITGTLLLTGYVKGDSSALAKKGG